MVLDESLAGSGDTRTPAQMYGAGPWLVLHGAGDKEVAEAARRQCRERQVAVYLHEIGKVPPEFELDKFPGLVVVLPADTNDAQFKLAAPILRQYRIRGGRRGLKWLKQSNGHYLMARVAQVVASDPNQLTAASATSIHGDACWVHYLNEKSTSEEVDFFAIYETTDADRPVSQTGSEIEKEFNKLEARIKSNGIRTREEAWKVRSIIERYRDEVFNQRRPKPKMYRPLKAIDANVLQIILQPGERLPIPSGVATSFQSNTARAVRMVKEDILKVVPTFERPNDDDNTRGAVDAFRDLYIDLVTYTDSPEPRRTESEDAESSVDPKRD
ncbi:hypothetical protein [Nocardia sp. NPDC004711]